MKTNAKFVFVSKILGLEKMKGNISTLKSLKNPLIIKHFFTKQKKNIIINF